MSESVVSELFEQVQAREMRGRHRRLAIGLVIAWLLLMFTVDAATFQKPWQPLEARLPLIAGALGLWAWHHRPRSTRQLTLAFVVWHVYTALVSTGLTLCVRSDVMTPHVIGTLFTLILLPLIGLMSWRVAVGLSLVTVALMALFGVLRPVPDLEAFAFQLLLSAFALILVWIGTASRDRLTRAELEARRKLTIANQQILDDTQARARVFAQLGHDFRTPLAVIRGEAELLARTELSHEHRDELARIVLSAGVLAKLTDQVLALAKHGNAAQLVPPAQPPMQLPAIPTAAAVAEGSGPASSEYVLVVEDDPALRRLLARVLGENRLAVVAVGTRREASDAIADRLPAAVVSDVLLPDGTAYDLLASIRNESRTRRLPVILVSALSDPEQRTLGILHGADDYIGKPFSAGELSARVHAAIERAEVFKAALEDQRRTFLMELHDGVKGSLARASMLLEARDADRERALAAVRDAIDETHEMLGLLDAGPVDWDAAVADLRFELKRGTESAGLQLVMVVEGAAPWLTRPTCHALQRVAREALTNTIRHAKATRVTCMLRVHAGVIALRIADDGRGLQEPRSGRGLAIMRRRAEQLGGSARIESTGAGVEVEVRIPLASGPRHMDMGGLFPAAPVS